MYSVSIRSIVLLERSITLGSVVLGQYSVSSSIGEIQDFSVRLLDQYSVSSSIVEEIQD